MKWSFQDPQFVARVKQRQRAAARRLASSEHWRKHTSNSTGCAPHQVERYRQFFKDKGVTGVEVTPTGDFRYSSRNSMLAAVKAQGYHNADEIK